MSGCTGDRDSAVLTVTDTGIGIDPDQQTRVFDRFYRAAPATREPRRRGYRAGGGRRPGPRPPRQRRPGQRPRRGQHLHRHACRWPPGHARPATGRQPADTRRRRRPGPRLLLVEDDTDLRAYLTRLLTADGWAVHAVPDAETALAAAIDPAEPSADLVLTDVVLPGRSGLHLVGELRADAATARMPMIVLTAAARRRRHRRGPGRRRRRLHHQTVLLPGTARPGAGQPRTAPAAGNRRRHGRGPRPTRSAPDWTATGSSAPPSAS